MVDRLTPSAAATTDRFDQFVAALDPAMVIATTVGPDGEPSGCLVGFATQCSIDPRRFLVCLSDQNHTFRIVEAGAGVLAVHLVPAGRLDLARRFGGETGDEVDKFDGIAWSPGPDAVPVLEGCPWFAGRVVDRHRLGDHVGFVLDPQVAVGAGPAGHPGAAVHLSAVEDLAPGHPA